MLSGGQWTSYTPPCHGESVEQNGLHVALGKQNLVAVTQWAGWPTGSGIRDSARSEAYHQ